MCAVIDTCVFSRVFGESQGDFKPIQNWIINGKGKMVMGGSKYSEELARSRKFLRLIVQLERAQKVVRVDSKKVDQLESDLLKLPSKKDFDDQHLVALVDESGCKVLCSSDKRADKFIKCQKLYKKSKSPAIYRSAKHHKHLICDGNIVSVCK